jgi:RNA-directed DNA polymerase
VSDTRVLRLIRRFLQAGMMADGVVTARQQGTPQGGPLSPLLSNILLTDLDRELEKRQLSFCRYADDCNIYVSSQRAGQRIMDGVRGFLANRLKLTVNEAKSAVARPWGRKFLGYSVTAKQPIKIRIATPSIKRLKEAVRHLCAQGRGRSLPHAIEKLNPILGGWMNYFSLTQRASPEFLRIPAPDKNKREFQNQIAMDLSFFAENQTWDSFLSSICCKGASLFFVHRMLPSIPP